MQVLSNKTNVLNITNISRGLYSGENTCFETGFVWIKKHMIKKHMIKHSSSIRVNNYM